MRFGVHLTHYRPAGAAEPAVEAAKQAEDLGFHSVWAGDHVVDPLHVAARYPHSPPGVIRTSQRDGGMPDPFILLAVIAGRTRRIALGFDVLVVPYRPPLVTAKQIASLDALSGGRVIVGVGVGWHIQEFEALGVPFVERGRRTEEAIAIWRRVWSGDNVDFDGEFTRFPPLRMLPRPAQPGGPPIWFGGDGPTARRRAGRLADGWIPTFESAERYGADIGAIRADAAAHGRPPPVAALQRPTRVTDRPFEPSETDLANPYRPLVGTPDQIVDAIRRYQRAGVEHLVFRADDPSPAALTRLIERLSREVLPAVTRPAASTPGEASTHLVNSKERM